MYLGVKREPGKVKRALDGDLPLHPPFETLRPVPDVLRPPAHHLDHMGLIRVVYEGVRPEKDF